MKKILLILSLLLTGVLLNAQENNNWQLFYNKKMVFKGSEEVEIKALSLSNLKIKTSDKITFRYISDSNTKGWKRKIYVTDKNDQNLKTFELSEQTASITVNASVLKDLIRNKQAAFIYTMALPKDKALAARIRVRRVLLCKIDWN